MSFPGVGLKKGAVSISCLLGCLLLEPSHHSVRKLKLPNGKELTAGAILPDV